MTRYIHDTCFSWYVMFLNYLISWLFSVWIGLNHNWIAFMSCHYDCSVSKKVCVILSDFPYMYIHCRLSLIWCAWVCEYISFHWNVIGKTPTVKSYLSISFVFNKNNQEFYYILSWPYHNIHVLFEESEIMIIKHFIY